MKKSSFYALCVLVVITVFGFVSIKANQIQARYQIERATSPRIQQELDACDAVLAECEAQGILDQGGVEAYRQYLDECNLGGLIELVQECEEEDNFDDTVGSGDAYQEYLEVVVANHYSQI